MCAGSSGSACVPGLKVLDLTAADRLHEAGEGGTRGNQAGASLEGAVMECCTGPDAAAAARAKVQCAAWAPLSCRSVLAMGCEMPFQDCLSRRPPMRMLR